MNNDAGGLRLFKTISPGELDNAHFLHSLIETALKREMLSEEDFLGIQKSQAELLRERIIKYCGEHNSSVPEETAKKLSDGMLYTEGVYLRTLPSPDAALKALSEESPTSIWENGLRITNRKLKTARSMALILMSAEEHFSSITYTDTVKRGLPAFFGSYNAQFFGDDKIISADYPTAVPVRLAGAEFIEKYTEYLIYEQKFLSCFSRAAVEGSLLAFEKSYKTLVFNVCSRILASALCVMLAGESPELLSVGKGGCKYIDSLLSGKSANELTALFTPLCERLFSAIGLTNAGAREYIKMCVPAAAEVAAFALKFRGSCAFTAERGTKEHTSNDISFSAGTPMPDREYRLLLDRLLRTEDDSEKANIILSSVKSLTDLEDVLTDTIPSEELLLGIISSLPDTLLAVMLRHYPVEDELSVLKSKAELTLSSRLYEYISALPKERAEVIQSLSESFSDDDNQ